MKKRLALLLSVAMAFSMFANVAFGASSDLTTQQKYDALVKEGIFTGIAGSNDPQLNATTTRAQFAKVLALTLDLAPVNTGNSFKDQNYSKHWAKPYVEALVKENLITGYADGKFHFNDTVTGEQMAKTFGQALGLEEVKDAAAIEGVSKWAYGWVQAVKDAGFDWSENGKWNVAAKRATLVEASYDVREALKVPEKLEITAKAVGASTLQIDGNKAIDSKDAKVTVKRGSTDIAIKDKGVTFSEDGKKIQIATSNKLTEGTYTVTLTVGEETLKADVKVDAEKIAKVEMIGDTASTNDQYTQIKVGYKVLNQYGESATKLANLKWTASKGTVVNDKDGVVTFQVYGNDAKYYFNEPVVVTGQDITNGIVVNQTYKVGTPARAASIEFKGVYSASGETALTSTTDFTNGGYYLLVDIKDQYGNKVSKEDVKNSLVATSSNPLAVGVENYAEAGVGPDGASYGIKLTTPTSTNFRQSGEVEIKAIAMGNGQTFTHKLTVEQGAEPKTIKLYQPEDVVAVGDKDVKIPFEALDAKGNKITSYKTLSGYVNSGVINLSENLKLERDAANGNAILKLKEAPKQTGMTVVHASIPKTTSFVTITIDVKEQAVPTAVKGFDKDVAKAYGNGAALTLKKDSFDVVDQYGRDISVGNDVYVAVTNWDAVVKNGYFTTEDHKADSVVVFKDGVTANLKASQQGQQSFQFALYKAGEPVRNSEASATLSVVAASNISSYEVEAIPTLFVGQDKLFGGVTQDVYLKVTGKRADGSSVVLSPNQYGVTTDTNVLKVEYDAATGKNKLVAVKKADETKLTVMVNGAELTPDNIEVKVKVSEDAQVVQKIEADTDKDNVSGNVIKVSADTLNDNLKSVLPFLKATDQYGMKGNLVNLANQVTFNVSNIDSKDGKVVNNNSNVADLNGLVAGDTVNLTIGVHGVTVNVVLDVQ